ncbi:MAG TPA: hypothetical protein VMT69_01610 [Kineosporiaceae bacterium]|nr:hypothetical protein [Kineosporiaceae bacterium]
MTCPHAYDVAPYTLGALDSGERAGVAAHLAECLDCQAVLESIAGLPGLLGRVAPDALEPEQDGVDDAMFERLVARARPGPGGGASPDTSRQVGGDGAGDPTGGTEPADGRGRLRDWARRRRSAGRRWAVAAAAAAVVAVGGAWVAQHRAQDEVHVVAASAGSVHATAWLSRVDAGTEIRLQLGGVAGEQRCSLVTVDRDGRRSVASTWEAGYSGTESFDGTVPVPIDRLAWLRVETETGTLLTLPVT